MKGNEHPAVLVQLIQRFTCHQFAGLAHQRPELCPRLDDVFELRHILPLASYFLLASIAAVGTLFSSYVDPPAGVDDKLAGGLVNRGFAPTDQFFIDEDQGCGFIHAGFAVLVKALGAIVKHR